MIIIIIIKFALENQNFKKIPIFFKPIFFGKIKTTSYKAQGSLNGLGFLPVLDGHAVWQVNTTGFNFN